MDVLVNDIWGGRAEGAWRDVGRAVVALATDLYRARWNQKSVNSGQLASENGFTDLDGSQPDVWRFIEEIHETGLDAGPDHYR